MQIVKADILLLWTQENAAQNLACTCSYTKEPKTVKVKILHEKQTDATRTRHSCRAESWEKNKSENLV